MAELPRVPFPNTDTQPIRYNLSAGDIAGPYTAIAQASDKAAGALSDVAVPLAEQAAAQSVRRDDSGNLVVDKLPPLVGDAAKSARLTIAAKLQPQIETDLLKQKLDNPNDPVGFAKSVSAYKPGLLKGLDGTLAVGVGKMVDNTSQQYLRSLMVERDAHDTSEKIQSFNARQKEMDDHSGQIAFQHGTDQPEYARLQSDRKTLYDDMENDPQVKLSHDRRVLLEQESLDKDKAQAIIGSTYRNYQTNKASPGAKAEAHRFLVDQFLGEPGSKLNMSVEKRLHYVSEGTSMLETASAKDTLAIADFRKATNSMIDQVYDAPDLYDPRVVDQAVAQAKDLDDPKSEALLNGFKDQYPLIKSLAGLSGPQAAALRVKLASEATFGPGTPAEALYWKTVDKLKARSAEGAEAAAKEFKERLNVPGAQFTAEEFNDAINMASVGAKPQLVKDLQGMYAGLEGAAKVPPGGINNAIAAVREAKAAPKSAAQAAVLDVADKKLAADAKGYETDPLPTAWKAGLIPKPGPFDTSNPAAFAGAVGAAQKSADLLQTRWRQDGQEFGPVKAISGVDAAAVGQQIMYGDSKNVAPTLQALSQLNDANYKATLDQKEIRDGVVGASQSNDPQRFVPAMTTLRDRWKRDPVTFEGIYGKDALDRVQAFTGLQGAPVDEVMRHLNSASDPSEAAGAAKRAEAAKDEVKKWSADDVAYQIGTGWPITGQVTGRTPPAPVDENQADILHGDFSAAYTALRKFGVPEDRAKELTAERLRNEWQRSAANNGQLMKYAPEKYYPPLGDPKDPASYKYLPDDLDKHMTEVLGPAVTLEGPPSEVGGPEATVHWNFKTLLADDRTRREITQGKSPSYLVHYTDERGKDQILGHRWAWDPGQPGMPEEKAYLGQTDQWSRNLPVPEMPSAVPTGHMADYKATQQAAAESRRRVPNPLMRGLTAEGLQAAHARFRDGR